MPVLCFSLVLLDAVPHPVQAESDGDADDVDVGPNAVEPVVVVHVSILLVVGLPILPGADSDVVDPTTEIFAEDWEPCESVHKPTTVQRRPSIHTGQ